MTSLDEEEGVTEGVADKAVAMVKEYLEKLLDKHSNLFSSAFLHKAVDLLDNVRPHPHIARFHSLAIRNCFHVCCMKLLSMPVVHIVFMFILFFATIWNNNCEVISVSFRRWEFWDPPPPPPPPKVQFPPPSPKMLLILYICSVQ